LVGHFGAPWVRRREWAWVCCRRLGLRALLRGHPEGVIETASATWAEIFDSHYSRYLRGECSPAEQLDARVTNSRSTSVSPLHLTGARLARPVVK
jgi:hypothetical protein